MVASTLIFETFLQPALFKAYQHIVEYIEYHVQVPTFLLNGESLDDFACAYADVGFVSPLSAFWLSYQKPAPVELLATGIRGGMDDDSAYPVFWNIVTRQELAIQTVDDLDGCTWAYVGVGPSSEEDVLDTCEHLPLAVGEAIDVPSSARAIHLLLEKKVDAIAIDTRMVNLAFLNSSRMATRLRVLGTYSVARGPLVIAATHLAPVLRKKIQQILLEVHTGSFMTHYLREIAIERFVPVPVILQLRERSVQSNSSVERLKIGSVL
jgi:hypothetical protein